ncbi:hypothetical protein KFK09_026572 [Dendrobium nobile]|uniref:Uncharacterized protein n=1 Tax=Dendrobium nobile TaxID=94219 RepID=A0A8T3A8K0_DENNO|nr:hypothetical protein KFK09_026572 [Dendrobium nobile]
MGERACPFGLWNFCSRILIIARMDLVVLMFAKVIKKGGEKVKLTVLEEDEYVQLHSHAFAGVKNSPDDHKFSFIKSHYWRNS